MPIHRGQDKEGIFYQWGSTGKKYYFDPQDKGSKTRALNKAQKQQTAIYSSGWKGDNNMENKMKIIKVIKKHAGDAEEQLWETCLELQHKYHRKYAPVDIYVEPDNQKNAVTIEINWPSIGASDTATTKKFADKLLLAANFADKIEAEIKKVHPNVKVIK